MEIDGLALLMNGPARRKPRKNLNPAKVAAPPLPRPTEMTGLEVRQWLKLTGFTHSQASDVTGVSKTSIAAYSYDGAPPYFRLLCQAAWNKSNSAQWPWESAKGDKAA